MTQSTNAIDLSQLPEPTVVEQINYETILDAGLQEYYRRMDALVFLIHDFVNLILLTN
jgi:phage-related baseplate assembly protein